MSCCLQLVKISRKQYKEKPIFLLQKGKITYCIPSNIQTHIPALIYAIVSLKYSSLYRSEIPIATGWQLVHTNLWIKMSINFSFFLNSWKLKHIFKFSEYHLSHLTSGMVVRTVCACVYKTPWTSISGWMCQAIKWPARIRQYWRRNKPTEQTKPPSIG